VNNKVRNIFFFIGIAAIVMMCFSFEVSFIQLWASITRAGYWLIAIIALWGVLYAGNTLSWLIIIRGSGECPVSFLRLYKLTITGFALNSATPAGLLGGEPYKIMELTPFIGAQRATSSVVLFSMMHIFSHFWFWVTSIVIFSLMTLFGLFSLSLLLIVLLVLMSIFCLAGIYLFVRGYKNGMVMKIIALLCRIPGLKHWSTNFRDTHSEDLKKIDRQISALHSQNKKNFFISLALEYTGRIAQSLEIFFMLLLFNTDDGNRLLMFVHSFLILAFTSLFANLLFFFPMQIGGREGGFAMSTAQMGMTNETGILISLMCRVREIFWTSVGLILMKVGNKQE